MNGLFKRAEVPFPQVLEVAKQSFLGSRIVEEKMAFFFALTLPALLERSPAALQPTARDPRRVPLHTSWWTTHQDEFWESVGLLDETSGRVWSTGHVGNMTLNETQHCTGNLTMPSRSGDVTMPAGGKCTGASAEKAFNAMLKDVEDVLRAGGADLPTIASCLVQTTFPESEGGPARFREMFAERLPNVVLTVVAVKGEWKYFNASATCNAVNLERAMARPAVVQTPAANLTASSSAAKYAAGLIHATVHEPTAERAFGALDDVLREMIMGIEGAATGSTMRTALDLIADCTAFVRTQEEAAEVRRRFETTMAIPPALTVALDKSGGMHQGVALMCLGTTAPKQAFKSTLATGVELRSIASAGLVFASGAPGFDRDGFDAFAAADAALKAGGGGLDTAVQCLFFMRTNDDLFLLFDGFREVFNHHNKLPPTRSEYVADSDVCADCMVTAKCFSTAM